MVIEIRTSLLYNDANVDAAGAGSREAKSGGGHVSGEPRARVLSTFVSN